LIGKDIILFCLKGTLTQFEIVLDFFFRMN